MRISQDDLGWDMLLHDAWCHFPKVYRNDEGYIHAFRINAAIASVQQGGLFP